MRDKVSEFGQTRRVSQTSSQTTLTAADAPTRGRRRRIDPSPHYKESTTAQADLVDGWLDHQLPREHLARKVLALVERFDLSAVDKKRSSLGRKGFNPRSLLAVLIYGSLVGQHEATKLSELMVTDAALRFLAGGHRVSERTLSRFRSENLELFQSCLLETERIAHELGLLRTDELSADSMRLRAHASTHAVRSLRRANERLAELAEVDVARLDDAARQQHEEKVKAHRETVAECKRREAPSYVTTNESAALLKFPGGGTMPGHRVTVISSGKKERIVVGVLVDASANDVGKLEGIVEQARSVLTKIGFRDDVGLRVRADAGYWSRKDLIFVEKNRAWLDALIPEARKTSPQQTEKYYTRERFKVFDDKVICPAEKPMRGPHRDEHSERWRGVACPSCPLKPQCTPTRMRSFHLDRDYERAAASMRARMAKPDARQLYNERIASIEPVFSNLQSVMQYRRVTSRVQRTILAEIHLKLLAHNVSRLLAAGPTELFALIASDAFLASRPKA